LNLSSRRGIEKALATLKLFQTLKTFEFGSEPALALALPPSTTKALAKTGVATEKAG
jgi:hypothetical protein